eukprot:SAG31_NODE_10_length_40133_cov_27.863041_18_plen_47_part_00
MNDRLLRRPERVAITDVRDAEAAIPDRRLSKMQMVRNAPVECDAMK